MKKNYFLFLCSALLSIMLLGTACTKDGDSGPAPTFPKKVTKTAVAGQVIELSFEANYDWKATISQNTYTYFQLLNGETTTNTVSGVAGKQTIKVNVADVTVFENAPVGEVTLTMNGVSEVIATITFPTTKREVAVYAPIVNEYGAYSAEYSEQAMGSDDVLKMIYGIPTLGGDFESTFYVPVKIVANFAYTVEGPEWLQAVEAGEAGATEYVLQAAATHIPADREVAEVNILSGSNVINSFNIEIGGYNDYVAFDGFPEKSALNAAGEIVVAPGGVIISGKDVVMKVCGENGETIDWFTIAIDAWDASGAAIQDRMVNISDVEPYEGASARNAYVFVFAKNAAPADGETLVEGGVVAQKYASSLMTTVVQYSAPATIDVNELDESCAAFAKADASIDYWFTEGALANLYLGSKYNVFYFGKDAKYAPDATSFVTSRPVKSFKVYSYDVEGSFVELTDDSWVECNCFYTDDAISRFKIETNINATTAEGSLNTSTGDYEVVILVEYNDGSYSAIYFHYNESSSASGNGSVAFANPELASQAQATLKVLKAGDELYDTFFAEYSSSAMPAEFYHLTYQSPIGKSMAQYVALTGVADFKSTSVVGDWVSYDKSNKAILMEADGVGSEKPGAVLFRDATMVNKVVILCTVVAAE